MSTARLNLEKRSVLSIDDLIGYQRAEFAIASHLRSWQLVLQFLLAAPAALSIFLAIMHLPYHV